MRRNSYAARVAAEAVKQRGFVLPYVLVVIVILSVACTIAATRLQNTTRVISAVQASARTARMIDNAESVAIFALLSGNSLEGGYDLNPQSPVKMELVGYISVEGRQLSEREVAKIEPDFWRANGGFRRVRTPDGDVIVSLQDVSGLLSLNKPLDVNMPTVFVRAGATPREARMLVARLADYTDMDNEKRAGGAEQLDYRLGSLPPPTNSPLRSYEELGSVLGWRELLPKLDMRVLKDMTTLQTGATYRQAFAKESHARVLGINFTSLMGDSSDRITDRVSFGNLQTSPYQRLSFWAQRTGGPDAGLWDKRVIEMTRQTGHITHPYRRLWVLETTVLESKAEFNAEQLTQIDHVFNSTPFRP